MIYFLKSALKSSFLPKAIPSLDGLRAVSVLLVIIGHSSFIYRENLPLIATYFGNIQSIGVTTFFCLSGFLINLFLIKDKDPKKIKITCYQ